MAKIKEDSFAIEHRLQTIIGALDIPKEKLDGATPQETISLVKARLEKERLKRTDNEYIQDSVIIHLSGESYEIKLRPIDEDFEWRKKLGAIASKYVSDFLKLRDGGAIDKDNVDESNVVSTLVSQLLPKVFSEGVNDVVDLLFLYAPQLPEDLRKTAKGYELVEAAFQVFEYAIPLFTVIIKSLMRFANQK